jgi:nucleotide-binding universal stress UspA family protein
LRTIKIKVISSFMMSPFPRIALAIAFSPRIIALLSEAARLKNLWKSELFLIHVGEKTEKEEKLLQEYLVGVGLADSPDVKIFWEKGDPAERILTRCKKEQIDLLIAGALKKEKLIKYYLGTVARKILRKADCSVLTLTDPSTTPQPFQNIVVNAENSNYIKDALRTTTQIAKADHAHWLHIVREIKMYGLTMSAANNSSEEEYEGLRQSLVQDEIESVQKMMADIPHEGLKINIKIVSGKSGFELAKFAHKKKAQLLVVGAPPKRFSLFDRVFPNDLEYVFADLPCNLLIVHPRKNGRKEGKTW